MTDQEKATLLKNKIEKIIHNNNLASMNTKDTHFKEMCLFSNNQLNQVINLLNIIMRE